MKHNISKQRIGSIYKELKHRGCQRALSCLGSCSFEQTNNTVIIIITGTDHNLIKNSTLKQQITIWSSGIKRFHPRTLTRKRALISFYEPGSHGNTKLALSGCWDGQNPRDKSLPDKRLQHCHVKNSSIYINGLVGNWLEVIG